MINVREFFGAVINAELSDEMTAYATHEIEKLDARNAKRREKPSKIQIANEPIKRQIFEVLVQSNGMFANEFPAKIEGVTTQKASSLLGQLVTAGKVERTDAKVKGKGVQKFYKAIVENYDAEVEGDE